MSKPSGDIRESVSSNSRLLEISLDPWSNFGNQQIEMIFKVLMIYHHKIDPSTEPQDTHGVMKERTPSIKKCPRSRKEASEGGILEAKERDLQGGETNQPCQILSHSKSQEYSYILYCKVHSWLS